MPLVVSRYSYIVDVGESEGEMSCREPKLVKWGKPSIYLANTDPRNEMLQADVEWMEKNCIFVEVNSPIFRANTE